jgi:hypothetical protein
MGPTRGYTRAVTDLPVPLRPGPSASTQIRLDPAFADAKSVAERLNDSGSRVAARIDRGELVIRPSGPILVAGIPAYWSSRPEFRGVLESADGEGLVLRGAVRSSEANVLLVLVGFAVAVMGVSAGVFIVLSGDITGVVAAAFSLTVGAGVIAGASFIGRLSSVDEQTISAALQSISYEPGPVIQPLGVE